MTTEEELISNEELNLLYGHVGKTFNSRDAAEQYASKQKGARIYPLWDAPSGVRARAGYLVSIESAPASLRRFTGKVRQPN